MKTKTKMIVKLLTLISFVFFVAFPGNAQEKRIKVSGDKMEVVVNDMMPTVTGDILNVDYNLIVFPGAIDDCSSMIVTPTITDPRTGKKVVLEVIIVNGAGKKGLDKWLGKTCNEVCTPKNVRVFDLTTDANLFISTNLKIKYEHWMEGTEFMITTQRVVYPKCIEKMCGPEKVCDVPFLSEPYVINPVWTPIPVSYLPVENEAVRVIKTRLYFPVNVTTSVENYFDNQDALGLLKTLNSANFDVTRILIEGWASPESSVAYNQNLSNNRAKTMKKIIADKYHFPESVYSVNGKGEYWDATIDFINNSEDPVILTSKAKLVKFVEETEGIANLDKKEQLLKKIDNGKPYKVILKDVYPKSRFTDCEVNYKVKAFTREDAMVIFKNDPSQLTADEYVMILTSEVNEAVLAKALKYYPNDTRISTILAEKARKEGNIDKALLYYQKLNSIEAINNQGCCWLLKGEAEKAQACFDRVKELNAAARNVKEVEKVILNNKYFKK